MIRTIKQRIYLVGLLPLALLAVALVMLNGISRINDANQELSNAQKMTVALLHTPAVDALVIGNTLNFEQTVSAVIKTAPTLVCVALKDENRQLVSEVGNCTRAIENMEYFPIRNPTDDLSDFHDLSGTGTVVGELGLLMNDQSVVRKRRQVIIQLVLSLTMIVVVLGFIGRVLRGRLIQPIQRIGGAMRALSQHDYDTRVPTQGDDEIARLAEAINSTIDTIAAYTLELERRRNDADHALQDADEANLARDGLVRSLTEDLEGPLGQMHEKLTAIAMANHDPALKEHIKAVLARLQDAQSNLTDLTELATHARSARFPTWRDVADIVSDIRRDIRFLSDGEGIPVNFVVTQLPLADASGGEPTGIYVDVDGVRLKKAIVFLIRAMSRRAKAPGIYVTAELIKLSAAELHISVHLKAFYEAKPESRATQWIEGLHQYGDTLPSIVRLTDRETKIIEYLLRAIGVTPTVGASPTGAVSVLLDTTCRYTVEQTGRHISTDWMLAARPIVATIVSNDVSLIRLTTRGDMSNQELKLISFSRALANLSGLHGQDALLIDISDEIAEAVRLLDELKSQGVALPPLIAICPPGQMSEALSERLLALGFIGTLQKPLHSGRITEVLRTTLSDPLKALRPGSRPDQLGDS